MLEPRDLIRIVLEDHAREFPGTTWNEMLAFALGYFGEINLDHIHETRMLQAEGLVK